MRPVTPLSIPCGVLGTVVGAVKNGTLESLHAAIAASASAPSVTAPRTNAARLGPPATPAVRVCVMLEPQVNAKEITPGRGEWTDVLAASDRLIAVDADLRVQSIVPGARPQVVSRERKTGARDTVARDP